MKTTTIAKYAMFAGLVFVATYVLKIPIFHGLPHMGDAVIMTLALTFGKNAGAAAGALGATLSALLSGYNIIWAPASFCIHGLEGYVVGLIAYRSKSLLRRLIALVIGSLIMAVLYQSVSYLLYGAGGAIPQLIGNLLQFTSGIVGALILTPALERVTESID
ncbi:MAG: ECF transporter S component [Negativicutes bacterium]